MTTSQQKPPVSADADEYYHWLCDSLGVALITTDPDLRIRAWNRAAVTLLGTEVDPMRGTPLVMVVPAPYRLLVEEKVRRAIDQAEIVRFDLDARDAQGARRELLATASPIVTPEGDRIGAALCIEDISDRIRSEKDSYEGRKLKALGQMAGAVAHHFNNTLGGIITTIDFALDRDDPAADRRALRKVSQSLIKAMAVVRGLLVFAEGDQRQDDLCDLTELLTHLADEIEIMSEDRNIQLVLELPQLPVTAVPRADSLTVLRNIAQNAIEAMPDGGTLTVSAGIEGDHAVIRICDTGPGMDAEAKSHLFEPFYTTKGAISAGGGHATGLGLAIAHGLCKNINGQICVKSEVGKGTCFTVTIPRSTL